MSTKNCKPNKDDWRNSTEPYAIELRLGNYVLTEFDVNYHIDIETRTYKQWPSPELKVLSQQGNKLELSNTNDGVRYILTIIIESQQLNVSCSCNRKVEMLCHHAYYALHYIVSEYGIRYFQSKI